MPDQAHIAAFAYECALLSAGHLTWLERRKLKASAKSKPYESIGQVVRRAVADPSGDWIPKLFASAESTIALGRPALTDFVALGLFEGFQNLASHVDVDLDPFVALLGPASRGAWDSVIAHWDAVADEVDFAAPKRMTLERYESMDHPELRAWLQDVYRRMPDGRFVGLADVILFEANHGGGPHVDKARR